MKSSTLALLAWLIAGLGGCASSPCGAVDEVCRIAGTGAAEASQDGKKATDTAFFWVSQVRTGPDGRVYVMDQNNYRLRVITDKDTIETIAGTGIHDGYIEGSVPTQSPFLDPIDFVFRPDGSTVILCWHDPRLGEIGTDGRMHTIAGTGAYQPVSCNSPTYGPYPGSGETGDGGPAMNAGFAELVAIAEDASGRLFLADDQAHQVSVIDTDGSFHVLGGDGCFGYDGDGGPAKAAHFNTPNALSIDPDGNLLVADSGNHVIRKIDLSAGLTAGTVTTVAGDGTAGFSGDGGPCTEASMNQPGGVVADDDGTLYISDTYNSRVRRVDPSSDTIDTFVGDGVAGFASGNGPVGKTELKHPTRLTITDGVLYIADTLNDVARTVRLR